MAGALIQIEANGAATWSNFVTAMSAAFKGSLFVSLSNFTGNSAPEVEDGSYCDINGAIYKLTPNGSTEAITGLAAIANSSTIYFYAVPSGSSVTCEGSTTAPTWSETKGGFFNGNNRCFGGCYKDGSGNYINKWVIRGRNEADNLFNITGDGYIVSAGITPYKDTLIYQTSAGIMSCKGTKRRIYEIGAWNMDANATTTITHNIGVDLTYDKILHCKTVIIKDDGSNIDIGIDVTFLPASYDYSTYGGAGTVVDGIGITITDTTFTLARVAGGAFDNANYDDAVMNRGFFYIEYYE